MGLSPMNSLKLATLSWGLNGDIVGHYGTVWESILIMWLCLKNSPILLFCGDSTDIMLDIKGYSVARYKGMYQQEHTHIYIYIYIIMYIYVYI